MQLRSFLSLLALGLPTALGVPAPSQRSLQNPNQRQQILTRDRYESTVLARRLLALSSTGVLSTIFPSSDSLPIHPAEVPKSVASTPIGLPEYVSACEDTGNPTLLALNVATSTRNAAAGSNISLSISWWDEYVKLTDKEPWSAADLPRASLTGYLEEISADEVKEKGIVSCFTAVHPDSRLWLPGDKQAAHSGKWARMVVEEVYWIGGFGDRNYIGWFDVEEWRSVSPTEWKAARLPGES